MWVLKALPGASWEPQIHQIIPQRSPFIHLLSHLLCASHHALRMQQRTGQVCQGRGCETSSMSAPVQMKYWEVRQMLG